MRKLRVLLFAAAFAVGASGQAGASPATITGSLGISVGALPPIQFPGGPVVVSVSSGAGSFTEPASVFAGLVALPTALFTGVALINGLTIDVANGTKVINTAGAIAGPRIADVIRPGTGALGGPGPLGGTAFVNVLGLFNLSIPLSAVGNTGATVAVAAGGLTIIVQGTGWTTGNVTLTGITSATPNGATAVVLGGFDNRASHTGTMSLISPFKVITIGAGAGNLTGLAVQSLTFSGAHVPEPGTILLIGSGIVGLALYGRRRLRK